MVALVTLLVVVTISVSVVRISAVALTMTGLSEDLARFQALSAFSGVGFTTKESESAVSNPTRRRIVSILMLVGNAGVSGSIATLVLTFWGVERSSDAAYRLGVIVGALALLMFVASSKLVDRGVTHAVRWALGRWTSLSVRDYAQLLEVARGYSVAEIVADPEDWLCEKKLHELRLPQEGVVVLGVRQPTGEYLGVATGDTKILAGSVLTCYGREEILKKLATRARGVKGEVEHHAAVEEHTQLRIEQNETVREDGAQAGES